MSTAPARPQHTDSSPAPADLVRELTAAGLGDVRDDTLTRGQVTASQAR